MKKTTKTAKKLSLNRETVRELDQSTLSQAQGAAVAASWPCSTSYGLASSC